MGRGGNNDFDGSAAVLRPIEDPRESMDVFELVEELHLSYPDEVADFERRHRDAMEAVELEDLEMCDPEQLDDLRDDLVSRLRI